MLIAEHQFGIGSGITAVGHHDIGFLTYKQCDAVSIAECPSMLHVVPIARAGRLKCLMILGIEVDISEVEVVFTIRTRNLNLCSHSVQVQVACNDIRHLVFHSVEFLLEPATHLVAFLSDGGGIINSELTDSGILLHCLSTHHRTVGIDICKGEVRLLNEMSHIVDHDIS